MNGVMNIASSITASGFNTLPAPLPCPSLPSNFTMFCWAGVILCLGIQIGMMLMMRD